MFLRRRQANANISPQLDEFQAILISNDLYGNDFVSAFKLAKGYSRPIDSSLVNLLLPDIIESHVALMQKI